MKQETTPATSPSTPAAETPTTWTFTDPETEVQHTVTCMVGCTCDHTKDCNSTAGDFWCTINGQRVYVPVKIGADATEEMPVLTSLIKVEPFSHRFASRLPLASIEVLGDMWIEDLDLDALDSVIALLAERVDGLRETRARLAEVRDEYRNRA